jgi:hypothetical protein
MTNATFHNFLAEPFTGYWNGKPKTFKPGERLYMPAYLAEHFAKHLTNQELIRTGKEVYVSPKNPGQVPQFMEVFKKAYIPDTAANGGTEIDEAIASAQVPSMNIRVEKPQVIEQGAAAALDAENAKGPVKELDIDGEGAQIINVPGDDDESDFAHDGTQ